METSSIVIPNRNRKDTLLRDLLRNRGLVILAVPGLLFVIVFSYLPMFGLVLAFKDYNFTKGIIGSHWVGFANFKFFFTSQDAWNVTRNTLFLNGLFIVITTSFSVIFALLLFELNSKAVKIHMIGMFFPYFVSWVVVSYVGYAMLNPQLGVINQLISLFGIKEINWYLEPKYWSYILAIFHLWKNIGYLTLIFYAGLMGIDKTYFEAAEIDGASKSQMMRKISIPLISSLITLMVLLSIGKIFYSDFGLFFFMTMDSGALYSTTDVIDTYVYRALRTSGDIGMSSAVGLYQSLVGFLLVLVSNYIVKKINDENSIF